MVVAMMRARDKLPSYRQLGQALSAVKARDWTLVVVGDGPARADVEAGIDSVTAAAPLFALALGWAGMQ